MSVKAAFWAFRVHPGGTFEVPCLVAGPLWRYPISLEIFEVSEYLISQARFEVLGYLIWGFLNPGWPCTLYVEIFDVVVARHPGQAYHIPAHPCLVSCNNQALLPIIPLCPKMFRFFCTNTGENPACMDTLNGLNYSYMHAPACARR